MPLGPAVTPELQVVQVLLVRLVRVVSKVRQVLLVHKAFVEIQDSQDRQVALAVQEYKV